MYFLLDNLSNRFLFIFVGKVFFCRDSFLVFRFREFYYLERRDFFEGEEREKLEYLVGDLKGLKE